MRLRLLNKNLIGETLANTIYLFNGVIYVTKGTILTNKKINLMTNAGVNTVYVEDGNEDINLIETIDTNTKIDILNELTEIFNEFKETKCLEEYKVVSIADKLIKSINITENSVYIDNILNDNIKNEIITHSLDVAILAIILGKAKNYSADKLQKLTMGALLHDIGKMIDDSENHCKIGYTLIKTNTTIPVTSYLCILNHHELEDGTGYPEGLKGNKMHEFSKIISICNEYINLLHSNKFDSINTLLEYLSSNPNKFDSTILREFIANIYCYPNGLYVKLNTGEEGIVVRQNINFPTRPTVIIMRNDKPVILNLMYELSTFINKPLL